MLQGSITAAAADLAAPKSAASAESCWTTIRPKDAQTDAKDTQFQQLVVEVCEQRPQCTSHACQHKCGSPVAARLNLMKCRLPLTCNCRLTQRPGAVTLCMLIALPMPGESKHLTFDAGAEYLLTDNSNAGLTAQSATCSCWCGSGPLWSLRQSAVCICQHSSGLLSLLTAQSAAGSCQCSGGHQSSRSAVLCTALRRAASRCH